MKGHKSDLPVVFAHLVLCCLADGDLWCSEAEHEWSSWVRPCLKLVGKQLSGCQQSWAGPRLGWQPIPNAAGLGGLVRSWGQAPGISLPEQQLQMSLQLSLYPTIVP